VFGAYGARVVLAGIDGTLAAREITEVAVTRCSSQPTSPTTRRFGVRLTLSVGQAHQFTRDTEPPSNPDKYVIALYLTATKDLQDLFTSWDI
jgi:hypothetical protein